MRWIRTIAISLAAVTLVSGCAMYRLEELRHATPSGSAFQNELAKLYMQFAEDEEKEYDWFSSWHFADKGLMSAYGKDVPPEEPKDWAIPERAAADLAKAHDDLLAVLTPEMEHDQPGQSANAQFYFDCWVEQQAEDWQEDDIDYCRENFTQTLSYLQAIKNAPADAPEPPVAHKPSLKKTPKKKHAVERKAQKEKPAAVPREAAASAPESASYIVFFEKGQPILSQAGGQVLEDVSETLKPGGYEVVISDHSGLSGDKAATLAQERADIVKKLLIGSGAKASAIHTGKSSETSARRRIEIYMNE